MIKGDLRKKEILETAESLFAERGYEATGVQDILDVLHLSKGSFYHHFESKEQVLRIICENRAAAAAERVRADAPDDPLLRMNYLLRCMLPFQGEGLVFLKMILPVFILPEGKSVRAGYQAALKASWLPMTAETLEMMIQQKQAYTLFPGKTAEMALDLVNSLWAEISEEIIQAEKAGEPPVSSAKLLSLAEPYRPALENLFSAPYGSLELIQLADLTRLTEELHRWWMVLPDEAPKEEKQGPAV